MDEIDHKILASMEKGISLITDPFSEIALQFGITTNEVVTRLSKLKEKGEIRRFGASIKPNNIGFSANALVAWKVPENRVQDIGAYLSKYQEISHCYERKPVNGRWDFNLYTVVHGRERETVQRTVKEISEEISINEYRILFSTRDLKRNVSLNTSIVRSPVLSESSKEINDP